MLTLTGGCNQDATPDTSAPQDLLHPSSKTTRHPIFTDQTEETGLDFVHFNGMYGAQLLPEITGSGGATASLAAPGSFDAARRTTVTLST